MRKRETITGSVYTVGLALHTQTQTLAVVCIRSISQFFFRGGGTKQLFNQNIKHNHHLTLSFSCYGEDRKSETVKELCRRVKNSTRFLQQPRFDLFIFLLFKLPGLMFLILKKGGSPKLRILELMRNYFVRK